MKNKFQNISDIIIKQKKITNELSPLFDSLASEINVSSKKMIKTQIYELITLFNKNNIEMENNVRAINVSKKIKTHAPLKDEATPIKRAISPPKKEIPRTYGAGYFALDELEDSAIDRIKKRGKKKKVVKRKDANPYVSLANRMFSKFSQELIKEGSFDNVKRDLVKAGLPFLAKSYVSLILFSTMISVCVGLFLMLFFLFFNLSPSTILSVSTDAIGSRFLKVVWIPLVLPIATFFSMYIYPSLEKSSLEKNINHELPFATIHMAAIAGSMIEPSKIFKILIDTNEYPNVAKEFTKTMNEMNIFGKDLITAIRTTSFNCPSKRLSDLLNGIAISITSGGELATFFEKRAESLLFEHRLEKEKESKAAETFMDIYISVVIAAPMILMLLLMMMKVSGVGISLSTTMISVIMSLVVSVINVGFLVFLGMRQK